MLAEQSLRKYALQNAFKYGKAVAGKILGKVLGENPDLRKTAAEVLKQANEIVEEVNALSKEEVEKQLKEIAPKMLEKKEAVKKTLKKLEDADEKKVILRFEPSPSGPLHIGHAYVLGLNALYREMYNGELILRLADTNPGNVDPDSYVFIQQDAEWYTDNKITKTFIQSDRMELYYTYALRLIDQHNCYMCTCKGDDFRDLVNKGLPCPCRDNSVDQNLVLWKDMFLPEKFSQGDIVMRAKTDLKHKNPAMRDFPLFRISDDEHPKQGLKYRVWPLMNMSVTVDDVDMRVTHILRGKDHADNARRQEFLHKCFENNIPKTIFVGRINFHDMQVSCSKTKPLIQDGTYEGWDDIRIPFMRAMRRRGYKAEAFRRYAMEVGVSLNDKKVSKDEFFKAINAFNKEIIEPTSHRYFFVEDPQEVIVRGAPKQDVELDLHPDNKKGGRKFSTDEKFCITKEDFNSFKVGVLHRLMDCLNFKIENGALVFDSTDYGSYKKNGKKIIHWLPCWDKVVKVEVKMDDGIVKKGLGEHTLKDLKVDDVVQFERFGFVRFDRKEKDVYKFWLAHK